MRASCPGRAQVCGGASGGPPAGGMQGAGLPFTGVLGQAVVCHQAACIGVTSSPGARACRGVHPAGLQHAPCRRDWASPSPGHLSQAAPFQPGACCEEAWCGCPPQVPRVSGSGCQLCTTHYVAMLQVSSCSGVLDPNLRTKTGKDWRCHPQSPPAAGPAPAEGWGTDMHSHLAGASLQGSMDTQWAHKALPGRNGRKALCSALACCRILLHPGVEEHCHDLPSCKLITAAMPQHQQGLT